MWQVSRTGEYPLVTFQHEEEGIECDHCGQVIPLRYADLVTMSRDGHHDRRLGKYAYCRTVYGSKGLLHKACR